MNPLVSELNRRLRPSGPGPFADRWSAWARALGASRARIALPGARPAMTLADPASVVQRSEYWARFVQTILAPRIELAVGPVVRQVIRRPGAGEPRTLQPGPNRGAGTEMITVPLNPSVLPDRDSGRRDATPGGTRLASTQLTAPIPVERVFARLFASASGIGPAGRTSPSATTRLSREIHDRVVTERRRKEEQVRRVMVEERRRDPSSVASGDEATGDRNGPAAKGWDVARNGASPWPVAPPLDLDRLTDQVVRQIDHRVTALRERLGGLG